jgi:hypothetical protein
MDRSFLWLMLAIAGCLGAAAPAHSSCNQVAPAAAVGSNPKSVPAQLPYRAADGRIDQVYMPAGLTPSFMIGSDPVCARKGFLQLPGDDVIVAVSSLLPDPDTHRFRVELYPSKRTCTPITTAIKGMETASFVLASCADSAATVAEPAPAAGFRVGVALSTSFARPTADSAETDQTSGIIGPVRVLLVKGGSDGIKQLQDALSELAARGGDCAALMKSERSEGVYACIDKIYLDDPGDRTCAVDLKAQRPWTPELIRLPVTSFREQCSCTCDTSSPKCHCTNGTGSQDTCKGEATDTTKTKWYMDPSLGGIHAAFNWDGVFDAKGRNVAGLTAVPRADENSGRIELPVPGREFLGSTAPTPSPGFEHLPDFEVWYDPQGSNEVGLQGVVDQSASVLHVYPRSYVDRTCSSDVSENEACLAVERAPTPTPGFEATCGCKDRSTANCVCNPTPIPTRFFACRGGEFAGRPCTRPAHCGSGTCDATPLCQNRGSDGVWKTPTPTPQTPNPSASTPTPGTACLTDSNCSATQQCGYALFDFSDKQDASNGFVTLKLKVKSGGNKQRGVCQDRKPCTKATPCADGSECVGYKLHAGELAQ